MRTEATTDDELTEADWKAHLSSISKEIAKAKPDDKHIKKVLETTHRRNAKWFSEMDDGEILPIMKVIPCYEDGTYVCIQKIFHLIGAD